MSEEAAAGILRRLIASGGPVSVETFMRVANAAYYGKGDPFGAKGDFVTAPEISQMFGECLAAALIGAWEDSARPSAFALIELGPGRGTLMADVLRTAKKLRPEFAAAAHIHLVETSPALIARQRTALARYAAKTFWHGSLAEVPDGRPLILVANEFFDALPVRQFVRTERGFCERCVTLSGGRFVFTLAPAPAPTARIPEALRDAPLDSIVELRPEGEALAAAIARRIARGGGCAFVIDYGHAASASGDTLQAVKAHAYADPLSAPGEADLTAHVDFASLAAAARANGAAVHGPLSQGEFLRRLGVARRAEALARANPGRAAEFTSALRRLTAPEAMGELFKAVALSPEGAPAPVPFR